MKLAALTYALLLSFPLAAMGRRCPTEVRIPYVQRGTKHVPRTSPCDYVCWGKWHKIYIESGYNTNTCELAFRTETKQDCCEGFEKGAGGECVPVCEGGCIGGRCIEPNLCGCDEGFRLHGNRCIPECESQCIYGVCTGPGQCTCLPGYANKTDTECTPVCDPPCENGKCIAPDTCECNHGFEKSKASNHQCKPRCDPKIVDCTNGACIQPNRCSCAKGYLFRGNRCIPQCDPSCINAECTKPDTCTCAEGFSKVASVAPHVCNPVCSGGCRNGTCVAPSTCQCHQGYRPASTNSSLCEPSCDPAFFDTGNGQCIAPNVLRCNQGFVLVQSGGLIRCKSRCDPECVNAECLPDGSCRCWSGFNPSEGSSYVCEPLKEINSLEY